MAKDIQIKYINETNEWEELYPVTKTRLVTNTTGQDIDLLLSEKANKNEVYTSVEIDNKLSDFEPFDIPVQETEPSNDSKFWFEVL